MVDLDFIEGWLEFQSLDVFDAPVDVLEKWIYSASQIPEEPGKKSQFSTGSIDEILPKLQALKAKNALINKSILENDVAKLNLNANEEGNENSYNHSRTKTINTMKLDDLYSECSLEALENPVEESLEEELSLPHLPDFKKRNSHQAVEDPSCITPNILSRNDGEITFFKSITLIQDKTWLPRHPQHHRLKLKLLQSKDITFQYFKNPHCPKSRNGDAEENAKDITLLKNLSHYRYSRKLKVSKKFEVMCRLCRGENWLPRAKFQVHMAFSHGVLLPDERRHQKALPILLPIPKSLFISRSRKFTNFFVKCPSCEIWISLGLKPESKIKPRRPSKNGIYFNYFQHCLKNHKVLH